MYQLSEVVLKRGRGLGSRTKLVLSIGSFSDKKKTPASGRSGVEKNLHYDLVHMARAGKKTSHAEIEKGESNARDQALLEKRWFREGTRK